MDGGFRVVTDELHSYADYMRGLVGHFEAIDHYVGEQGSNTTGFTGLLSALVPVVEGVGKLFGEALAVGKDRLGASADGLDQSAATYEAIDRNSAASADRLASQLRDVS